MKQLVVLVEKSKLGDIPKFHNFLTSFSDDESSCRGHLGELHSSSLIFSELIRLIYLLTWLSNTFIRCLFSILRVQPAVHPKFANLSHITIPAAVESGLL